MTARDGLWFPPSPPAELDEVEIYVGPDRDRFGMTRFGRIGNGPVFSGGRLVRRQPPPVMCVLVDDVCGALQPGGDSSYGGVTAMATHDGMFCVDSLDGSWIWELFPARWSDGHGGPIYVAVWPD